MKKTLVFALILCLCTTLMLSSCSEIYFGEKSEMLIEETATQTEELKKLADPMHISKIKDGMNSEAIKKILGVSPIEINYLYDVFIFTDGRVIFVTEAGSQFAKQAVNSELVNRIKIGDTYDDVTQKLGTEGFNYTNMYGNYAYGLSDGRCLLIQYKENVTNIIVESFYFIGD